MRKMKGCAILCRLSESSDSHGLAAAEISKEQASTLTVTSRESGTGRRNIMLFHKPNINLILI